MAMEEVMERRRRGGTPEGDDARRQQGTRHMGGEDDGPRPTSRTACSMPPSLTLSRRLLHLARCRSRGRLAFEAASRPMEWSYRIPFLWNNSFVSPMNQTGGKEKFL